MTQKTYSAKADSVQCGWYLVDASGKTLGRLAAAIAHRLRGKHRPEYTPHVDTGDHIVVINARHARLSGRKFTDKVYHRHSGYPGGLKSIGYKDLLASHPERPLMMAVRGMLPSGPLGRAMLKKLRVYADAEHPHSAQQPQPLNL